MTLKAAGRGEFLLTFDPQLAVDIVDAWFSPSYGVRTPVKAVDLTCRATLAGKRIAKFVIAPNGRANG